ncbi:outer membrane protein assembly factor BamB family protein [Streptomyces sp. 8N114]|uniref:outer membrane protein assembly factor BamB family protein n=1 Tax=Streptomyces sp. 8N114 TaxID=3457419 RepID=UPI003FD4044F
MVAFDVRSGRKRWEREDISSPQLLDVGNGHFLVPSDGDDGKFSLLSARSGNIKWHERTYTADARSCRVRRLPRRAQPRGGWTRAVGLLSAPRQYGPESTAEGRPHVPRLDPRNGRKKWRRTYKEPEMTATSSLCRCAGTSSLSVAGTAFAG